MDMRDFPRLFPEEAAVLETIESQVHTALANSKFGPSIKLIDSFIFLFSDDIRNSLSVPSNKDTIIVLYSEAFKRIRSSYLLALRGYFVDCVALLRSVFELNKAINAIQNGIMSVEEYLSGNRDANFRTLSKKAQDDAVQAHIRQVDNKINAFDDQNLPDSIRENLRLFKSNMHISVHKALGNIALNIGNFRAGTGGALFGPTTDLEIFGLAVNYFSFMILIYLRNVLRSQFINNANKQKLNDVADFIARTNKAEKGYNADIIEYIELKYR